MLKKEETKKAVSSIKSKLSAPKVAGSSLEDKGKQKHGTFSASLSREQILASQARHEGKMRALGPMAASRIVEPRKLWMMGRQRSPAQQLR